MAFTRSGGSAPPVPTGAASVLLDTSDYVRILFAAVGVVAALVVACVGLYWACVPPAYDGRLVAETIDAGDEEPPDEKKES